MKRILLAALIISLPVCNLHAQWDLVGKVTTGSQFELTRTGHPVLSNDSTKIYFTGRGFLATYDIRTNTLTDFTRDFIFGDEGMTIDYARNRLLGIKTNMLRVYDLNTHALIHEFEIGIEGTAPSGMYIDKKRDELIIIHGGFDVNGAVSIMDMNDFHEKYEFITNGRIPIAGYALLDEERSNLYLFYDSPDRFEVFSLATQQVVFSSDIQVDYGSPSPLIDYKNDRIILCDGFEYYRNTLISLTDYSIQYPNTHFWGYQISVDTVSNRIWAGNSNGIDAYDLMTLEVLETITAPESFVIHSPFSCPKFNYLFGLSGDYILIFELSTHNYLGRVKIGASPYRISVDYLHNAFYTKESNGAFTLFNDFTVDGTPRMVKYFEFFQPGNGVESGVEIWPEGNRLIFAGYFDILSFDYQSGQVDYMPIEFSKEIEIDTVNKIIFASQQIDGPEPGTPVNRLFACNYDLDILWSMVIAGVNGDLEYDNEKYLYYLALETVYEPGINTVYKIDTRTREIVGSIKFNESLAGIEYSKALNKIFAPGLQSDLYPGRLYVISCSDMTLEETLDIPGARIGYLAESLGMMFIVRADDINSEMVRLLAYDINGKTFVSDQLMPAGADPAAIGLNPVTNSLYVVDPAIGGVYKYRNDAYPAPAPPGVPDPPLLTVGDNQIEINWNRNETAKAYNLYRRKLNEDWICVNYRPIVDTFFKDLNLINNIEYSYSLSLLSESYIEGGKSTAVKGIPVELPDFVLSRTYSDNICTNDGKEAQFTFGIQEEASFNDTIRFSFENLPAGISTNAVLKTFNDGALSIDLNSDGTAKTGNYTVTLVAAGGGQTHALEFSISIQDHIDITLEYYPSDLKTGDMITISGSTHPLYFEPLKIKILNSDKNVIAEEEILSDGNGVFETQYVTMAAGNFFISAGLNNYSSSSDTLPLYVTPGDVSITCVTNVTENAEEDWGIEVTGMVFPNPGGGTVRLQITSPREVVEFVDNIPLNDFGFYGHTFSPDTTGTWRINASYSGNENFSAASSYTNLVPIGIKPGYSIIFTGDASVESLALDTTFSRLGEYAYNVMLGRHLEKENIYFIHPDMDADPDGNGQNDDVDDLSGTNSLRNAFTWAKSTIIDSLDLTIYLVSKGDTARFLTNGTEYLPIDSLSKWIGEFRLTRPHSLVNIVIENSYGKNYIRKISGQDIRIMTSTNDTVAYFFNYGDISFSGYFWNYMSQGASFGEALAITKNIMNDLPGLFFGQECLVDANFNKVPGDEDDYSLASGIYLGYGTRVDCLAPEIIGGTLDFNINSSELKKARAEYTLEEVSENDLYLSVLINSPTLDLSKVYAILVKNDAGSTFVSGSNDQLPGYKIYDLQRYGNTNYYIARIVEFIELGNYTFIVYAADAAGLKAIPGFCQVAIVEMKHQSSTEKDIINLIDGLKIYPNPFTAGLTIEYEIIREGRLAVKIYDQAGSLADIIDHGVREPGIYSFTYTPEKLSPGLLIITFEISDNKTGFLRSRVSRRLIYVK